MEKSTIKTATDVFIIISFSILIYNFYTTRNKIKTLEKETVVLSSQLEDKEVLLKNAGKHIFNCSAIIVAQRDSMLSIIRNTMSTRPKIKYITPEILKSSDDELILRLNNFLNDPQ
jgi:hypothetical protein